MITVKIKKYLTLTTVLYCSVVLFSANAVAQGKGNKAAKEDICHFDADSGLFHVINISQNAVPNHFANHGDAYPGIYYSDSDADGFGDNLGGTDSCAYPGFVDNDSDAFPQDPTEWADTDGDGVGDNADLCPTEPGTWEDGCPVASIGSDLIVANNIYWNHSNGVTALLNDGSGAFTPTNYHTRLGAGPIRIADFNNDGNDDFIIAHYDVPNVHVGLGNGSGGFAVSEVNIQAHNASRISINDFNNDGNADVAIARNSGYVTVGLGDGNGNFVSSVSKISGGASRSVATGDLDGDGNVDAANIWHAGPHGISIHYGDGAGDFAPLLVPDSGSVNVGIAIGDIDNDGELDIVTGGQPSSLRGPIHVYRNNGTPAMGARETFGPLNLQSAVQFLEDMDGDGSLDVVASGCVSFPSGGCWSVQVYYNDGNGNFNTAPLLIQTESHEIHDVVLGDFNEDGIADLANSTYTKNAISISLGDGLGGFLTPYLVTGGMTRTVGLDAGNFD